MRLDGRRRWAARPKPADLRHAIRVTAATLAAFAVYHAFDLPQGYWAVFTVVIVMQGSIGGTLGASTDRMIGTLAGAVVGGALAAARPQTPEGLGAALAVAVALTTLGAAARESLKVAPVTAAIMLLSPAGSAGPLHAALFRVTEIGIGSAIAVAATLLILPARSHTLVLARLGSAAEGLAGLLDALAARARGAPDAETLAVRHDRIRAALNALETALGDAARERQVRLGRGHLPEAVLRGLWRIRTDAATAGRGLDTPLPEPLRSRLPQAAATLLSFQAGWLRACDRAAAAGARVDRGGAAEALQAFDAEIEALRRERLTAGLTFDEAGRAFAVGYALESLHRHLADLSDRLDEVAQATADTPSA